MVTVIIPTVNRYKYLVNAIDSIFKFSSEHIEELIIVDQTPRHLFSDDFYRILESKKLPVRWKHIKKMGQSTARNLGISEAQTEFIYLYEDDGEATDDIIGEHIKIIKKYKNACTTGPSHAPWKTREMLPDNAKIESYTTIFSTGNALIRKASWKRINGFDLNFDNGMGADSDFGTRLYLSGFEVVQAPEAIMVHHKAKTGGLRTFGAFWLHSFNLFKPYPPITTLYQLGKYYSTPILFIMSMRLVLLSIKEKGFFKNIPLIILFPFLFSYSFYRAQKCKKHF
tara:strand:+ start:2606 stop:3454 length:849 start_codon:yes stop_codon:yes gene_type:complete